MPFSCMYIKVFHLHPLSLVTKSFQYFYRGFNKPSQEQIMFSLTRTNFQSWQTRWVTLSSMLFTRTMTFKGILLVSIKTVLNFSFTDLNYNPEYFMNENSTKQEFPIKINLTFSQFLLFCSQTFLPLALSEFPQTTLSFHNGPKKVRILYQFQIIWLFSFPFSFISEWRKRTNRLVNFFFKLRVLHVNISKFVFFQYSYH